MTRLNYIEVTQPIGTFYITAIEATIVAKIADMQPRSASPKAVQRDASKKRITEIAAYCSDADATFPTPIIISIYPEANVRLIENTIEFNDEIKIGEIIDGQHRIRGIVESKKIDKFQLPVILMFNLTDEEKAYVFSIINSKQTQVSMSLIYDLFALAENRSPYKTCHELARSLNADEESPFFNRLKMLGKKEDNQYLASLSQGTFVKYIIELISKSIENADDDTRRIKNEEPLIPNESLVFRDYFIKEQDNIIYKLILNLFTAVAKVFPEEWNNPDEYILSKSIGFGAIIKAFPTIYRIGDAQKDLSTAFFESKFIQVRNHLNELGIRITSNFFGSNEQARTRLSNLILDSIQGDNLFKAQ